MALPHHGFACVPHTCQLHVRVLVEKTCWEQVNDPQHTADLHKRTRVNVPHQVRDTRRRLSKLSVHTGAHKRLEHKALARRILCAVEERPQVRHWVMCAEPVRQRGLGNGLLQAPVALHGQEP